MKASIILISILLSTSIFAQNSTENWFTDFDLAKEFSLKNDVPILMVFAGSDWCRPCIQFKKEILEDQAFANYAEENLAILYLDFPSRKKNKLSPEATKKNDALAEKYNRSGAFPKILLCDTEGMILKDVSYNNQQTKEFINEL